jgi:hypothetical protein
MAAASQQGVRLQNAYEPAAYHLDILVDRPIAQAEGYVARETVQLRRKAGTAANAETVTLHASSCVDIIAVHGASIQARDAEKDTVTFRLDGAPSADELVHFDVVFRSIFQHDMKGLYRSSFRGPPPSPGSPSFTASTSSAAPPDASATASASTSETKADLVTRWVITTHMEPCSARHAYVCVDEPSARADFRVSLTLADCAEQSDYEAFSGGALLSVTKGQTVLPEWALQAKADATAHSFTTWTFDKVPLVPPYLTALLAAPVEKLEDSVPTISTKQSTVPLRVIAMKGRDPAKLEFTMKVMKYSFAMFERMFAEAYPLPKLDFALVPDFPIGGQENWGLILGFEGCLVLEQGLDANTIQRIGSLVAHEVSHNWFGNLVGIDWWEGLWLKEGFATFCGNLATETQYPFVDRSIGETLAALGTDGYHGTHPVEMPIHHPAMITQIFDTISYSKGYALIAMVAELLGSEPSAAEGGGAGASNFDRAVASYVQHHRFGNTTTKQLWESLERSSGKPVMATMNGFVVQPGHPVLTVEPVAGVPELLMRFSQSRYHHFGEAFTEAKDRDLLWSMPIPVTMMPAVNTTRSTGRDTIIPGPASAFKFTLAERDAVIKLTDAREGAHAEEHVTAIVNVCHTGFYRTYYHSDAHYRAVLEALPVLGDESRVAIIDDIFALYDSGHHGPMRLIDLATKLRDSTESSSAVLPRYAELLRGVLQPLFWAAMDPHVQAGKEAALKAYEEDPDVATVRTLAWVLGAPIFQAAHALTPFKPGDPRAATPPPSNSTTATAQPTPSTPDTAPVPTEPPQATQLRGTLWIAAFELIEMAEWWPDVRYAADDADLSSGVLAAHKLSPFGSSVAGAAAWYSEAVATLVAAVSDPNAAKITGYRQGLALRYGPKALAQSFYEKLLADPDVPTARNTLQTICRNTRSTALLEELLNATYTATKCIRAQNSHMLNLSAAANPTTQPRLLAQVFERNYDAVVRLWGAGQFRIQSMVERVSSAMWFDGGDTAFAALMQAKPCANATLAASRGTERVRYGLRLARHQQKEWRRVVAPEVVMEGA